MTDIIDFNAEKIKRETDSSMIYVDPITGKTLYKFLYSFDTGAGGIGFDLWAESFDQAKDYIDCIKQTLRLDGRCIEEIPLEPSPITGDK
jgi:hypothetical protein